MLLDQDLDLSGLLIQIGDGFGNEVTHSSRTTTGFKAIEFLSAKILELFQPAGESLELFKRDWQRRPGRWVLGSTKAGNHDGIKFVGFAAFELSLSEPLDLQGVLCYHTNCKRTLYLRYT